MVAGVGPQAVALRVRVGPQAKEGRSRASPEEAFVVGPGGGRHRAHNSRLPQILQGTQHGAQLPWVGAVVVQGW